MTNGSLSRRNEKIAIKQRHNLSEPSFSELAHFDYTVNTLTSAENSTRTPRNSDPQSSKILSTADLISAVNYVRNYAYEPFSILLSKTDSARKPKIIQESDMLCFSTEEAIFRASNSADDQPCSGYLTRKPNSAKLLQANPELLKMNQKILPSYDSYAFWRLLQARPMVIGSTLTENCLSRRGLPPNLGSIYGWMDEIALAKPKNQVDSVRTNDKMACDCYNINRSNPAGGCMSTDTTSSSNNINIGISDSDFDPEAAQPTDISCGEVANVESKVSNPGSQNVHLHTQNTVVANFKILTSRSDPDSQETDLVSSIHEINVKETMDGLHEHTINQGITFVEVDSSEVEINSPAKEKPHYLLAKQEHAFAGAMAGIFVSLCLHPMDTIKTVIQSCRADQRSLHYIGRSIISERGVMGLYRGISSNIVSSAPISAVYTFTYESMKKTLLPLLPKEYHSLAHCTAGACASIATSFIFTPSERIKQQMQVGSRHRNSWNALIEVVQKGGLPSLYTGWGAVLCRNVPHSVIKFYTYESLKQNILSSVQPTAQATTLVTLVCGGLAGSVASLFTTPFDVVKTRLQTQIPGSIRQYNSVFNTLTEIGKHEGLKGLYRGLTPRLVMYMIQGALFFASYESFKRLLSLEVPQLSEQTIRHEQRMEDDSTTLASPVSVSARYALKKS